MHNGIINFKTLLFIIFLFQHQQDERFNREIDILTGYRTKALLCMPIKDVSGDVVGVAQVINKQGGDSCFTANDEKVHQQIMIIKHSHTHIFYGKSYLKINS